MGELTKPELRSRFRRLRAAALPATEAAIQAVAARELTHWLKTDWLKTDWLRLAAPGPNSPCGGRGNSLGLYWPLAGEADLRGCLQQNLPTTPWSLALPAIASTAEDPQLGLRYRPWRPGDPLAADHCGIAAPLVCPPLPASAMAALLLPCLALDSRGLRLGYGGGWFDRLRAQPGWRAVPALGVLPAACLAAALPQDPWDVPLDGWIDENGLHWL